MSERKIDVTFPPDGLLHNRQLLETWRGKMNNACGGRHVLRLVG